MLGQTKMNLKLKKTERGWPGHFISAHSCYFRRNTLLEYGDRRIIVSTVGNMHNTYEEEIQEIGLDRYYETMAFEAIWEDPYWEANVKKEIYFENEWAIGEAERGADGRANLMHDLVVSELGKALINNSVEYVEQ